MFIPYLDMKKLASHPYIIGGYGWRMLKKGNFVSLTRITRLDYVISRMRVFTGGKPLIKKDDQIEPSYVDIAGQKMSFDCAVYAEVDHFRVEYASRILFHEMNQDKDRAIQESEAIRLSKPFPALLSPYCQLDSDDIDSD
ncbi:hypothetical protein Ahy_A03g012763 [Arachis hypogaea]|uniref:Uncharacterized protein n=1 Tax=Arachis hypogaea TaxID=3818 RepID=A0A445DU42_ARAHY|nr:hypothetical protein Ahy_A03g012763 [Arachis hypogaea]